MSLQTNLDKKLSPEEIDKHKREERNDAFIKEAYERAERAEREDGIESPDVIFEDLQRDDIVNEDPVYDRSRESLNGRTSLPIKQYRIRRDGTLVKETSDAGQQAIRDGIFCWRCEERQPDDRHASSKLFERVELLGFDTRGMSPKNNCAYCGAVLGFQGREEAPQKISESTDEQKDIKAMLMSKGPSE